MKSMAKKNNREKQQDFMAKPVCTLKPGEIFEKKDHIYTKQMILSDRDIVVGKYIMRECVAWNDDQCKRFDATESELYKSAKIGELTDAELQDYILQNKKDEWGDPKAPKY